MAVAFADLTSALAGRRLQGNRLCTQRRRHPIALMNAARWFVLLVVLIASFSESKIPSKQQQQRPVKQAFPLSASAADVKKVDPTSASGSLLAHRRRRLDDVEELDGDDMQEEESTDDDGGSVALSPVFDAAATPVATPTTPVATAAEDAANAATAPSASSSSLGPTPTLSPTTTLQTWDPTASPAPTITGEPTRTEPCWVCNNIVNGVTITPNTKVPWRGVQSTCAELTSATFVNEFYDDCVELTALVTASCQCDKADESSPTSVPTSMIETVAPSRAPIEYPVCLMCPPGHALLNPNMTLAFLDGTSTSNIFDESASVSIPNTCRDWYLLGQEGQLSPQQCRIIQNTSVITTAALRATTGGERNRHHHRRLQGGEKVNDMKASVCLCDDTVTLTSSTPVPLRNSSATTANSTNSTTTTNTTKPANSTRIKKTTAPTTMSPTTLAPTRVATIAPTASAWPTRTPSPSYSMGACLLSCRSSTSATTTTSVRVQSDDDNDDTQPPLPPPVSDESFNFFGLMVSCRQTFRDASRGLLSPDLCEALQDGVAEHCPCALQMEATESPTPTPTLSPTTAAATTQTPTSTPQRAPTNAPSRGDTSQFQFPNEANGNEPSAERGSTSSGASSSRRHVASLGYSIIVAVSMLVLGQAR